MEALQATEQRINEERDRAASAASFEQQQATTVTQQQLLLSQLSQQLQQQKEALAKATADAAAVTQTQHAALLEAKEAIETENATASAATAAKAALEGQVVRLEHGLEREKAKVKLSERKALEGARQLKLLTETNRLQTARARLWT